MDSEMTPDPAAPNPVPPPLHTSPARAPIPPTPPRRSSGRGWIIAILVVAAVLIMFAIAGVALLNAIGTGISLGYTTSTASRRGLQEVVVESANSRNKIAVVDLQGIISDGARDRAGISLVELIRHQLELAADDPRVRAVLLYIDSPGGEVLASDEIANAIRRFQQDSDKPVVASMQSLAASGGYYAAAPCRWIVAHEMTLTGSIGVILHGYNYRSLMDKVGVHPQVYKSGRFKDMLSGEKPVDEISPEERKMIQSLIDETFARFKRVVLEGRDSAASANAGEGRSLTSNWEEYADGRILSGQQAFEYGFVDELGNFETAVKRACSLAGIHEANLVRYQRPFELGNLFRLLGKSNPTLRIDLGLEIPQLQAGHLYFLAPSLFP